MHAAAGSQSRIAHRAGRARTLGSLPARRTVL